MIRGYEYRLHASRYASSQAIRRILENKTFFGICWRIKSRGGQQEDIWHGLSPARFYFRIISTHDMMEGQYNVLVERGLQLVYIPVRTGSNAEWYSVLVQMKDQIPDPRKQGTACQEFCDICLEHCVELLW